MYWFGLGGESEGAAAPGSPVCVRTAPALFISLFWSTATSIANTSQGKHRERGCHIVNTLGPDIWEGIWQSDSLPSGVERARHTVEWCWRCYLFSHLPDARCWQYTSRQNRHNTRGASGVKPWLSYMLSCSYCIRKLFCIPYNFPPASISISICSSSVTPPSSSSVFCLRFCWIIPLSPINCSSPASLILSGCQSPPPPLPCRKRWACVSPVYCVSGTFQLACIPASGCVGDKMEPIPPGCCYLCFPPVTHKQTYTFKHASARGPSAGLLGPSAADAPGR